MLVEPPGFGGRHSEPIGPQGVRGGGWGRQAGSKRESQLMHLGGPLPPLPRAGRGISSLNHEQAIATQMLGSPVNEIR